jgi:hypothetical protein
MLKKNIKLNVSVLDKYYRIFLKDMYEIKYEVKRASLLENGKIQKKR